MPDLVITLPLPPREVSPNSRGHWGKKARAVDRCREDAGYACQAAMRATDCDGATAVEITPLFYFRHLLRRDGDNLNAMLKPYLDGLADAGLVENDNQIRLMPPEQAVDKADPRVELVCVFTKGGDA